MFRDESDVKKLGVKTINCLLADGGLRRSTLLSYSC